MTEGDTDPIEVLVKKQTAGKEHECSACVEKIEKGEPYYRVLELPEGLSPAARRKPWLSARIREWPVEKFHELCYAKEIEGNVIRRIKSR